MSDGGTVTVTSDDGYTITSDAETSEQLTESLKPDPEPAEPAPKDADAERLSSAASELGKAAAAKRAEAKAASEAPEAEDPEAAPEKKLGKPRDDPRARMLEATRKEAEAKREAARLAARVAELEARQAKPAEAPKAQPGTEKPKQEDFESYEEFVDARAAYVAQQEFKKQFEARRQEAFQRYQTTTHQEALEKHVGQFTARIAEATKTDPEWMTRVSPEIVNLQPSWTLSNPQQSTAHNVIADEITSSEAPKALMLHLTENPDDYQRIAALPNRYEISRAMAKLEARLVAAPQVPAPKAEISKASPPVKPVSGVPHTADSAPGDDASFDEHLKYWNSREKRRA